MKPLTHAFEKTFLYDVKDMIKGTFSTELNKEFSTYGLITFSSKNKNNNKLILISPNRNLMFHLKKDVSKTSLNFELGKVHTNKSYSVASDILYKFSLFYSKNNKTVSEKRIMLDVIDTIPIPGLQIETQNFLMKLKLLRETLLLTIFLH